MNDDELVARHIEPDPDRPGADEVRLKLYGQHVWAIIGDYLAHENPYDTARAYEIPVEAVRAAVAYYRRHKAVIDNRLAANSPDFEEEWYQSLAPDGCMSEEDELIARYIEPGYRPGAEEVRLKPYGQHVWAIIGDYFAVGEDLTGVARDYDIPLEAVKAALLYYARYKDVIDNRLAANMV